MSSVTTDPSLRKVSTESQYSIPLTSIRALALVLTAVKSCYCTDAPQPLGPYGQGIVSPPFVFTSGCLGLDPKTGNFVEGGVEAQTRQALQNLKGIVEASGSQVGKIVKTTVRTVPLYIL